MKMVAFTGDLWKLGGVKGLAIHPSCDYVIFVHDLDFYCMSNDCYQQ